MIKSLLKPLRYVASDDFTIRLKRWRMQLLSRLPLGCFVLRKLHAISAPKLELEAFGMKFPSRIGLAAGYDRNGTMIDAMAATGFGFVEIGSITPHPQHTNVRHSLYKLEGDRALLYNSEIESAGVEQVIKNIKRHSSRIIVGCNIAKGSTTPREDAAIDYLRLFRPLYQYADYFTVNIACNTAEATYVPRNKDEIMAILTPLFEFRRGQNQYRPILLKISPDLTDEEIDTMTDIMLDTPLDGIVACAGTTGRYGLENSKNTMHSLGRIPGALCGRPLKERAREVVGRIYERSKGTYPIIGCGGIATADDALAMLEAGATLVQVGTEYIYGGGKAIRDMRAGLNERLRKAAQRAAQSQTTENTQEND
ncbi:MAG: quinone-dependent dihydroorotate dehydrogenase [Alistipes sp.]|nr:quinone-dependent dihydroorotate dehydrogenase [Alistipes sp.]